MLTIGKKVGKGGDNVANDVMLVQVLLNANISKLPGVKLLVMDGKSGDKTEEAIREYQRLVVKMKQPDGRVDPDGNTIKSLVRVASISAPVNLTAAFERTRFSGKNRQMKIGRITVNNQTYYFTCGGHGRGNIPTGKYTVTAHRNSRSGAAYSTDGVGYSFALSNKWDSRAVNPKTKKLGDTRTELRIHPDGRSAGTNGCIGVLGGAQTQKAFRSNMNLELKKNTKGTVLTVK